MSFKNVFSDRLAREHNFHQKTVEGQAGSPPSPPQAGRIICPCKNHKKFSSSGTKPQPIPVCRSTEMLRDLCSLRNRARAMLSPGMSQEKRNEENTRGSITHRGRSYLAFITSTRLPISSAWQTLSWWKQLRVKGDGGNIQAMKCQVAFQKGSNLQPHQEGCLKRQSGFWSIKCLFFFFFF